MRNKRTEDVTSTTESKPKTTRKKPVVEPSTEAKPPAKPAARKKVPAAEVPAEPVATPKRTRAAKPAANEAAPAPEKQPAKSRAKKEATPAQTEAKLSTTKRPSRKPAASVPDLENVEAKPKPAPRKKTSPEARSYDELKPTFRAATGNRAPAQAVDASPEEEPVRERSHRNKKSASPAPSKAAPYVFDGSSFPGEEFPIPTWRAMTTLPTEIDAKVEAEEAPPLAELAPRRSRNRRRRGGGEDAESPAASPAREQEEQKAEVKQARKPRGGRSRQPEAPAAMVPPKPVQIMRETIAIPSDAPQVVSKDGVLCLVRNRKIYPPISFFGTAPDEARLNIVMEQVKLAAESGIELFSFLVDLEVNPETVRESATFASFLLKRTLEHAPAAQVLFRINFCAPKNWESLYPDARFTMEGGGIAEPSISDSKYWEVAEQCLTNFIELLQGLEQSDQILGLHLDRGEWFYASGVGYDTSASGQSDFQNWLRLRYGNDVVALRAAWFDGQIEFDTVAVPAYGGDARKGENFVRMSRKSRRWVDYHLFLSDAMVERISRLAFVTKKVSKGYFLVGVSYGYTFEWSHPASGHLSIGKLLRCPEIDFVAGPPSYKTREPGHTASFPCPVDSCTLNGKLYISEEDYKTPISGRQEPDDFNPVIRTPLALESVHWRGVGATLAHQAGVSWMDLWGNGWLNTAGIWARGGKVRDALARRVAMPVSDPDVAVFIDERSLSYLVDETAFDQLVQNVREAVLRSGMSASFYLLSDLAHREEIPDSKLYIFMNAWDIRPEVRSAIKTRLQRDGKVLFWLYAAGLFEGGRDSLERVREVTGIALKPQPFGAKPGTTILNRRHLLTEGLPEKIHAAGKPLEPSYFAIPEDGQVLGEYTSSGMPSFVIWTDETEPDPKMHWTSVFLGEPVVTPALIRALGQQANAHVWNFTEDVVHVRAPYLTVHCTGPGPRTITLPDRYSAYSLNTNEWVSNEATHLTFNGLDGMSYNFLVGYRQDLEELLTRDPQELLTLDELPPHRENTVRLDAINFDTSIVKLDEWMEEAWTEEMSDDFLLKPSQFEIDVPDYEELRPERSSKNRGKNRARRGGEEGATRRSEGADREATFGDIGMNVVFRKRD